MLMNLVRRSPFNMVQPFEGKSTNSDFIPQNLCDPEPAIILFPDTQFPNF